MSDAWMNRIKNIHFILFDYTALFEMGRFPVLDELADTCVSQNIQVVISASFQFYHTCVIRAASEEDIFLIKQTKTFYDKLSQAGLLRVEESMSLQSACNTHSHNRNVCLMVGSHAPILYKIRNDKTSSDMSILVFDKENGSFFPNYDHYLQQCKVETVNSVTSSSDYLDVSSYCNVGDSVYTKDGQEVQLTVKINTGAEGLVFRTNDHKVVAKIYHRGILTPLRWMKLTHMTRVGLRAKGICWPTHLLYNQSKEPVGFIMPAAEGYTLGSVFDGPDAIMDRFPDWDRFSVTQAACQVLEKIIYLHLHGILIGDLQLKNIMIHNPSEVYLIDMDSVQIENLPCPVGTEDFTPPELWDHSFASFLREPQHEDYSCSILAFSMLFCGQHPYNQRQGRETLREEISARAFPYSTGKNENSGIPLGGYDKIWESISPNVQNMFCRAFSDGVRFETISWYAALLAYRDQLAAKAIQDPHAYELFPYFSRVSIIPNEIKTTYKKSIREAIIHSAELPVSNNGQNVSTSDRVMYNGRKVGVAFINQEKLLQLEKMELDKNANKSIQTSKSSALTPTNADPPITSVEHVNKRKTNKRNSRHHRTKNSNQRLPIYLLAIFIILLLAFIYLINKFGI
jgi:serine/threonine protein kinase